jgi:ABC-2 type transport system ATP-binding protein
MTGPILQVSDYHKAFGEAVAVRGLSFEVEPGQILGMLGPNGAGKTTTMRALAGIIPPTRGRLVVDGHDLVEDPVSAKRALAYVPDEPRLFESLNVEEHLFLTARIYGVLDPEERTSLLLERFDLEAHRTKLAGELSRGMRQKVAICCAYLHEPRAILFDEPFTGLDPRAIRVLKESIRERAASGVGIVVSSHLLDLVEDLSTHLLALAVGPSAVAGIVASTMILAGSAALGVTLPPVGIAAAGTVVFLVILGGPVFVLLWMTGQAYEKLDPSRLLAG